MMPVSRLRRSLSAALLAAPVLCFVPACHDGGAVAKTVQPTPPKTPDEIECEAGARYAEPLVVDLPEEDRGRIEQAMKRGVVVVSYDCKTLKVLPDCHIDGTYGFQGMQTKQRVLRIQDADELHANLPNFVPSLAAKIEAELQRGSTLDIALVMIGAKRTTWIKATPKDLLPGSDACAGATHFVKGATIGAFTRKTGSRAHASTAVEVFGAGGGGSSDADEDIAVTDGELSDCQKASPDAETPPPQCQTPVRLELTALAKAESSEPPPAPKGSTGPTTSASGEAKATTCPRGFAWVDGMCKRGAAVTRHVCKPDDEDDCRAQCQAGDAPSCASYGVQRFRANDARGALDAFMASCKGDDAEGCLDAGIMAATSSHDLQKAAALYQQGCDLGNPQACAAIGSLYFQGNAMNGFPKDDARAVSYFRRSCQGGDKGGCTNLGFMYEGGSGVRKDDGAAARLFKMACDGDEPVGCNNLGYFYETGTAVNRDEKAAALLYQKACRANAAISCVNLGAMVQRGVQFDDGSAVEQSESKAKDLFRLAYRLDRDPLAASMLNVLAGESIAIDEQSAAQFMNDTKDVCMKGSQRNCAYLGIVAIAMKIDDGYKILRAACEHGDAWACWARRHVGGGGAP